MSSVERRAVGVSESHHGLATDGALVAAGISSRTIRRRVAAGTWRRVAPGVVEVRRAAAEPWGRLLTSAVLSAGPGAVVSHRSAAAMLGLGGLRHPTPLDVTVPRPARWRDARIGFHTTLHPVSKPVTVSGLPVTPIARTLRDLAVVDSAAVLSRALHDALAAGCPREAIAEEASTTFPGARRLRDSLEAALDLGGGDVESPLELAWVRALGAEFSAGMTTQHHLVLPDGRRVRIDIAWPRHLVAVEVDGRRWHADALARVRDLARHDALTAAGWTVIRVTADDLTGRRLAIALDAIRRALSGHG